MDERTDSTPKESTGTPPPALNYDVLLNVIDQSRSLQTGFAIVSTCRVLYNDGARILLRKPVTLSTEPGLRSFLDFLRSAPLSRPQHLRDLSLRVSHIQPKLAQRLGRICPSMTGLKSLTMYFPDSLLSSHPGLSAGLAQLGALTRLSLSLSCWGTLVCTLLRLLHSPLKIISLSLKRENFALGRAYWGNWSEHHPTVLLENFADTLEELTCERWGTSEDYIRPHKTFPRLRRLTIEQAHSFYLAPYVQAFPNLARISVLSYYNDENVSCDEVDEDLEDNHELNVSRQLLPASVHGGTWEHMEEFEGSFVDFYVFGFACHIPRLHLDAQSSAVSNFYLPFFAEMLSHTRPTYLKFTTCSNNDCDGLHWLSAALRGMSREAQSSLKTLEFRLKFERSVAHGDLAAAMEDFASAIQELNISALSLTIAHLHLADAICAVWNRAMGSASVVTAADRQTEHTAVKVPRKPPLPLTAEERMMEDFDVAAYTRRLVEALQTLRDVEIVIERPRQRGRRVATLARDGSCTVECLEYEE